MAHEIDHSTGKPAIAYVGETPWHGLGESLAEGQPIDVWIKAARLDWELKRLPVQFLVDSKLRVMDDRFVLARSDTGAALSVVAGDYHIVQPKDVLEFFRDLVASFHYTLETAGALNGGRKVWALAKTGKTATVPARTGNPDHIAAYVLLATSCDKSLATTIAFTSIRVVCQNTLFFAIDDIAEHKRRQLKVQHSHRFEPDRIKRDLGLMDKAWEAFIEKASKMARRQFEPNDASSFFQDILLEKDAESLSARAERDHASLMSLYQSAPGQELESAKGTLWGTVNAVSYYVDQVRFGGAGDRLDSAWFGAGARLKNKAWITACDLLG
jgi:phage/plasmid-like protein (TIGR03299 family)